MDGVELNVCKIWRAPPLTYQEIYIYIYINPCFLMLTFIKYNTCFYLLFGSREEINCDLKKSLLTTFGGSLLALCELSNSEKCHWIYWVYRRFVCFLKDQNQASRVFCPTDPYSSSFLSHRTSSTLLQSIKVAVILLQYIIWLSELKVEILQARSYQCLCEVFRYWNLWKTSATHCLEWFRI